METPNSLYALWVAYSIVWLMIFTYMVFFSIKITRLEKQSAAINEKLNKN